MLSSVIDSNYQGAAYDIVGSLLKTVQKRNAKERMAKLNRARERIETENRTRVEQALNAMSFARNNNFNILDRAPAHFRHLLAIFLRPGFKKSFITFARKMRHIRPSDRRLAEAGSPLTAGSNVASTSSSRDTMVPLAAGTAATRFIMDTPSPRRAISLDYPAGAPSNKIAAVAATASAVAAASQSRFTGSDTEGRRKEAFGDVPPTTAAAGRIATGKRAHSGTVGEGDGSSGQTSNAGAGRTNLSSAAPKWRTFSDDKGLDLMLTAGSATRRLPPVDAKASPRGDDPSTASDQDLSSGGSSRPSPQTTRMGMAEESINLGKREANLKDRKVCVYASRGPTLVQRWVVYRRTELEEYSARRTVWSCSIPVFEIDYKLLMIPATNLTAWSTLRLYGTPGSS